LINDIYFYETFSTANSKSISPYSLDTLPDN
jgi:hypothetical protein